MSYLKNVENINRLVEQSIMMMNVSFTYQKKTEHHSTSKNKKKTNHQNSEPKKSIRETKNFFDNEHIKKRRQSSEKIIFSKQRHDKQL